MVVVVCSIVVEVVVVVPIVEEGVWVVEVELVVVDVVPSIKSLVAAISREQALTKNSAIANNSRTGFLYINIWCSVYVLYRN